LVTAGFSVGAVDFEHRQAGRLKGTGQPGAVRAGSFHPDHNDTPLRRDPRDQRPVAGRGRLEGLVAQLPPEWVDHRGDMEVRVGVDPNSHRERLDGALVLCDDGHRCPLVVLNGWAARCQQTVDKTVMGA
jgi:hypothetical protein